MGWMTIFIRPGFSGLQSNKKYRQRQKDKNAIKSKQGNRVTKRVFTNFIIFILFVMLLWIIINKEIMPVIKTMARYEANMVATKSINRGVNKALIKNKITTQDLLFYDYNEKGEIISWNVNSMIINDLCTEVAENIIAELEEVGTIPLKIPSGIITGVNIFSSVGPQFSIRILPIGSANVDYQNQLRATGINQVNHVVWLEVETNMQVIAPLSSEEMIVKRKIVLVDKVISGKVPSNYINMPKEDVSDTIPKKNIIYD